MKMTRLTISLLVTAVLMTTLNASAFAAEPKYKADVPKSLLTPDKVQTETLGELSFFDGMPSDATVNEDNRLSRFVASC